jgi:phage-related protein
MSGDAVVILDVFSKKTGRTPRRIIEICQRRLRDFGRVT